MASGQVEVEYILLVRKDSGIITIADLRGKKIALFAAGEPFRLVDIWCDVLLAENGLEAKESFFGSIKKVDKASQGILPVFFKQVDGAIVPRSFLEMSIELNPQLGKQLTVLAASPRLVPGLICIRKSFDPLLKADYVAKAVELHEEPGSRQTFIIFRVNRLMPWKDSYLENVRKLLEKHKTPQNMNPVVTTQKDKLLIP